MIILIAIISFFQIINYPSEQGRPTVTVSPSGYLVAFEDNRTGDRSLMGARIEFDGTVLDPEGFMIFPYDMYSDTFGSIYYPAATYRDGLYYIAFNQYGCIRMSILHEGDTIVKKHQTYASSWYLPPWGEEGYWYPDISTGRDNIVIAYMHVYTYFPMPPFPYFFNVSVSILRRDGIGIGFKHIYPTDYYEKIPKVVAYPDSTQFAVFFFSLCPDIWDTVYLYMATINPEVVGDIDEMEATKIKGYHGDYQNLLYNQKYDVAASDEVFFLVHNITGDSLRAVAIPIYEERPILDYSFTTEGTTAELQWFPPYFYVFWVDNRFGNLDIFARRFDSHGYPVDSVDIRITDLPGNEIIPRIAYDGEKIFMVFEHNHNIYGCFIDPETMTVLTPEKENTYITSFKLLTPISTGKLTFLVSKEGPYNLAIYDIVGRVRVKKTSYFESGINTLNLPPTLRSGTYILKLNNTTRRFVLISN